ncbi:MAG: alpha/beta hydrolase [Alphaproteobacteria bacterium]|nr:MAG: alpha/beta hydrolase [Alphaproteobacteria bacterium]
MTEIFSPRPGVRIAYRRSAGAAAALPGAIFLGGFRSDMTGTKATYLEECCKRRGQGFVRFDYTGHGQSSGKFEEACVGQWLRDSLDVFDSLTTGPQIVVGSSLGGWLALLLALRRPERTAGLVLLAPAPDFTDDIYGGFGEKDRHTLEQDGVVYLPSAYGDPYPLTRRLFDDAKQFLLLKKEIPVACPVRIIHGRQDADVPWRKSEKIRERLAAEDVKITWVPDGDHRLSRAQDLRLIDETVKELASMP